MWSKMASNVVNVVFPDHFNPKTDQWCDYKELMLCALDLAGYEDINQDKARALFLTQCGKKMYALLGALLMPARPINVSLPQIFAVLEQFYEPQVNEILQADKFYKRVQQKGESVQDYVVALGVLGAKCNFDDLKRQMRDQLVIGIRGDRLKKDLAKIRDLTFEKTIEMCQLYQANPEIYLDPEQPNPVETGKVKLVACVHCAGQHDTGEHCRFAGAKCFYCKKPGHITTACSKKKAKETAEGGSNADRAGDGFGLYNMGCMGSCQHPITAEVSINGEKLLMAIDSGAATSIISESTYNKLWPSPPLLKPTNMKLVTLTREAVNVLGSMHVNVVLGNKKALCELTLVSGNTPSLLGWNWFKPLGISVSGLC